MTKVHTATSSPKARELVAVVLAEFDRWAEHAPGQAAGLYPNDPKGAAVSALADIRGELDDHLVIAVGVTLASWSVTEEPE
jgi:hypothetical protein